jgi:ABC-type multidrug transport system ATPase subunit
MYSFAETANDTQSRNFFGINSGIYDQQTSGILTSEKNIIQTKCQSTGKMSPYFQEAPNITSFNNHTLNDELFERLESLNQNDFSKLQNESLISILPDGAITINTINSTQFSYKLQINDNRLPPYHRANGVTKLLIFNPTTNDYSGVMQVANGMIWAADLFNRAYFKNFFEDVVIISGVQIMPYDVDSSSGDNIQRIINLAGSTFYPMAVSLLMPLFMYTIVLEKESKLIEIMKINGMKMRFYWLSNFSFNFLLYTVTMFIFNVVGGVALKLSLFTDTNLILLFLIYLGWGLCQVGMAFFFQAFLSNARSATIIGYIISLWTTLLAVSLNYTIFDLPKKIPIWLLTYPTFNICRIFYFLTVKCGYESCISSLSNLDEEMIKCIVMLFIMPFVYIFLGIYLYEVIPQQFGVRKHPLFCFKSGKKGIINLKKKMIKIKEKNEDQNNLGEFSNPADQDIIDLELNRESNYNNDQINYPSSSDEEIISEIRKIQSLNKEERVKYPLVVDNLTKIYESHTHSHRSHHSKLKAKKALNNLNLALKNNEIFGLLGPNGAGKTTFFSLLTGIYEPTSGNAYVGGFSIRENINKVQELIGYCPQFDLLWNDLSVEEHLYFYSRLKNVKAEDAIKNVQKTLYDIKLENFRNFLVKELSGGMKRRLSLGISIVGNPSIVFLDEPTTGLDPENKRQIWEILSNCKENKCMILTTHLMEEAEVLSDRIGIIVNGQLKCLGTQYKLKKIYGKGFKLVLNLVSYNAMSIIQGSNVNQEEFIEDRSQNVVRFVKGIFPSANLTENYKNTLIFEVSDGILIMI